MPNEATAVTAITPTASMVATGGGEKKQYPRDQAERAPDLRLVIEEGPRRGSFIYKTVDRLTGETIKQYPREQLVKLSEDPNYVAGAVADTKA